MAFWKVNNNKKVPIPAEIDSLPMQIDRGLILDIFRQPAGKQYNLAVQIMTGWEQIKITSFKSRRKLEKHR